MCLLVYAAHKNWQKRSVDNPPRSFIMNELFSGTLVGVALAAPVGPVGILCIRLALTQGRWAATAAGMGAAMADAIFGAVSGLGLILIQNFIAEHQQGLGLIGGLIVMGLGISAWRTPATLDEAPITLMALTKDFAATFSMAITNPATMVAAFGLIAAIGPIDLSDGSTAGGRLVAGIFLGSALWWLALASITIGLRQRITRNLKWVNKFSGGLFLAFGAVLVARAVTGAP